MIFWQKNEKKYTTMCNQVQCLNVILVKQTKMFKTVIGITSALLMRS